MKRSLFFLITILLASCQYLKPPKEEGLLATAANNKLYKKDIVPFFSASISKKDSIVLAKSLIEKWALKKLIIAKAEENLTQSEVDEINQLVNDYKQSLLINIYKKQLISQRLDTIVAENEVQNYYNINKENFKLKETIIRYKYLHTGNNLVNEKELEELFKSDEQEDFEELEKQQLSFKSYNFNDTIWQKVDKVLLKVPVSRDKLLKNPKFLRVKNALGVYLVAVKEMRGKNTVAPYSYVKSTIKDLIIHHRKLELNREIEKIILKDAVQSNNFIIH